MPALSEIETEIRVAAAKENAAAFDAVRLRHMRRLAKVTGNNVAIYATCFVQKLAPDTGLSITQEDVHGFMNILSGTDKQKGLDLILHSPGGSAEAAEGIADYLHQHFAGRKIRVIVPYMAMSAATMLVCAADSVVMGSHSSLGPVDPQLVLGRDNERRSVAAHSVVSEFEDLLGRRASLGENWAQAILGRYGIGLVDECNRRMDMSKTLTERWLRRRMFKDDPDGEEKAGALAEYLADHAHFRSHGRRISYETAREKKMKVGKLEAEENGKMQDPVLSVFHALCFAFSSTPAAKIIANDAGRVFIRKIPFRQSP